MTTSDWFILGVTQLVLLVLVLNSIFIWRLWLWRNRDGYAKAVQRGAAARLHEPMKTSTHDLLGFGLDREVRSQYGAGYKTAPDDRFHPGQLENIDPTWDSTGDLRIRMILGADGKMLHFKDNTLWADDDPRWTAPVVQAKTKPPKDIPETWEDGAALRELNADLLRQGFVIRCKHLEYGRRAIAVSVFKDGVMGIAVSYTKHTDGFHIPTGELIATKRAWRDWHKMRRMEDIFARSNDVDESPPSARLTLSFAMKGWVTPDFLSKSEAPGASLESDSGAQQEGEETL